MTRLLLCVGNGMMGDDGAGPLLARMVRDQPLEGWQVMDGGSAPENLLYQVREAAPRQVLIVDAAEMGLSPGEFCWIDARQIADPFLLTTHSLPLTFLVEAIQEFVPQVHLLGIQPEVVAFGYPISREVREAVEQVYAGLKTGEIN